MSWSNTTENWTLDAEREIAVRLGFGQGSPANNTRIRFWSLQRNFKGY